MTDEREKLYQTVREEAQRKYLAECQITGELRATIKEYYE